MSDWEDFIHSSEAVGSLVRIRVSPEERLSWPFPEISPGTRVVQFDARLANGSVGTVVTASYCGWLKIEIADHGVVDVPGWYLEKA